MIDYVNKPAPIRNNPNKNTVANVVLGVIVGVCFLVTVSACFFY